VAAYQPRLETMAKEFGESLERLLVRKKEVTLDEVLFLIELVAIKLFQYFKEQLTGVGSNAHYDTVVKMMSNRLRIEWWTIAMKSKICLTRMPVQLYLAYGVRRGAKRVAEHEKLPHDVTAAWLLLKNRLDQDLMEKLQKSFERLDIQERVLTARANALGIEDCTFWKQRITARKAALMPDLESHEMAFHEAWCGAAAVAADSIRQAREEYVSPFSKENLPYHSGILMPERVQAHSPKLIGNNVIHIASGNWEFFSNLSEQGDPAWPVAPQG
jgi:hypothetical protein